MFQQIRHIVGCEEVESIMYVRQIGREVGRKEGGRERGREGRREGRE